MTASSNSNRTHIIEALMLLAAERDWNDFSLSDVAKEAGVPLSDFRDLFPSKGAILGAFSRQIDQIVLKGATDDLQDESAKDRLFDVLMRRLDAMRPYRAALKGVLQWAKRTPSAAIALNQVASNSHRFMLEAAGISTEGPVGALKIQGLVLGFTQVLEVWIDDDSEDLGATMAALDKTLDRGGKVIARAEDVQRLTAPLCNFIGGVMKFGAERRRARKDHTEAEPAGAE